MEKDMITLTDDELCDKIFEYTQPLKNEIITERMLNSDLEKRVAELESAIESALKIKSLWPCAPWDLILKNYLKSRKAMSRRYRFVPTGAIKRFLHPELAARSGEISDTWDEELMEIFPGCFYEIKDVISAEQWVNKEWDSPCAEVVLSYSDMATAFEAGEENERLKHKPKESLEELLWAYESCGVGATSAQHGFRAGYKAALKNRGYDES